MKDTRDPLTQPSAARERVLAIAEQMFTERGYVAVTLKDIADALGIKVASLYYHAPKGKEALFIEVTERMLATHQQGLEAAIRGAQPNVRARLYAAVHWLMAQPLPDFGRMMQSDMPALDPASAERLSNSAYTALMGPVVNALVEAAHNGEVTHHNPGLIAGSLLYIVNGIRQLPNDIVVEPRHKMAETMIDVLLNGLRPR